MPCVVSIEGDTSWLVPDLCRELARELTWAEYGTSIIPSDAAPHGTVPADSAEYGGLVVSLDANQPAPEYSSTNAKPDVSEVRIVLSQPITANHDDLELLKERRQDICDVLANLNGTIQP